MCWARSGQLPCTTPSPQAGLGAAACGRLAPGRSADLPAFSRCRLLLPLPAPCPECGSGHEAAGLSLPASPPQGERCPPGDARCSAALLTAARDPLHTAPSRSPIFPESAPQVGDNWEPMAAPRAGLSGPETLSLREEGPRQQAAPGECSTSSSLVGCRLASGSLPLLLKNR